MDDRRQQQPLHYGLDVWKDSMRLARDIYRVSVAFPESERFGLTAQLRRCAVSVPSNIAEVLAGVDAKSMRITCASHEGH